MKSRNRIAIVTPGSFPIPSGNSSSVEQVVEKLSEELSKQVKVIVLGRKATYQAVKEKRQGVLYIRSRARRSMGYIRFVGKRLLKLKPDFIQVDNRPRYVRYLRRRLPKARIVLVLHSTCFTTKPHISRKELVRCLKCANRIVVNSTSLRSELLSAAPMLEKRVVVEHLGVDINRFTSRWSSEGKEQRLLFMKKLGIENRKIILYAGRLIKKKGVHHLLHAMHAIREQCPEALLLVVGSAYYGSHRVTPYVRELHRLGAEMPAHVTFIPYVPHQDMPGWYQLADVIAVPSYNEAFGLVNIEAMAVGVPVVGTNAGGLQEIIESGMTGYLVEPDRIEQELADCLIRILKDPGLQRCMGEQGIARVHERFTWDKAAERRLTLFRGINNKL